MKIRNPNIEIPNTPQPNKTNPEQFQNEDPDQGCLEHCGFSSFEFVSDFEFRISNLYFFFNLAPFAFFARDIPNFSCGVAALGSLRLWETNPTPISE
jgi:hypothetical protein